MYVGPLPIPDAVEKDRKNLLKLAEQAAQAEGPALTVIEDEINQIVYRLFDLTPEEIRLIERTIHKEPKAIPEGEHGKTSTKNDFFRRLRELADAHPYLPYERIKEATQSAKLIDSIKTLKDYLTEAVDKGILHDAGKGWYSSLNEPAHLDPEAHAALVEALEKAFPLLEFSVWSTTQLNPWLHHLLAQPVHFLNAPADALETIGDTLRDEGWEVAVDPADGAARKVIRPGERMVVLRPALSRQPAPVGRQAGIEQMCVDLLVENKRCGLMDDEEAKAAIQRVLCENLLQVAGMQRYAESRKLDYLGSLMNRLSSLDATQ